MLADIRQANGEGRLVRRPIDPATGKEYEKCTYALFPGSQLGAYEPELLIKLYDSLRFQMPDTGVMFLSCGTAAKEAGEDALYQECLEGVRNAWEELGRPTLILACPQCMKTLAEELPEIPTVSLYSKLIEMNISGGCNHAEYILWEDGCDVSGMTEDVRTLAEDMGAGLQPGSDDDMPSPAKEEGQQAADSASQRVSAAAKAAADPYLTCSMTVRNRLKREGCDAVHILELIYGMGETNAHLVHEHEHEHEHCGAGHSHEHSSDEHERDDGDKDRGCVDGGAEHGIAEEAMPDGASEQNRAGGSELPDLEQCMTNRIAVREMMLELYWS